MNARHVESDSMGRPPADDPLNVQLSFRVNESAGKAIDAEIELETRPGWKPSRGDMARMLLAEALEARAQARKGKGRK
jgi:hypothetical protein